MIRSRRCSFLYAVIAVRLRFEKKKQADEEDNMKKRIQNVERKIKKIEQQKPGRAGSEPVNVCKEKKKKRKGRRKKCNPPAVTQLILQADDCDGAIK